MNPPPERSTPRVFTRQPLAAGAELTLEAGPSRHLAGALRRKPGDCVTLFDGNGGEYDATITGIGHRVVHGGEQGPDNTAKLESPDPYLPDGVAECDAQEKREDRRRSEKRFHKIQNSISPG